VSRKGQSWLKGTIQKVWQSMIFLSKLVEDEREEGMWSQVSISRRGLHLMMIV
jgi:hypothetical protein